MRLSGIGWTAAAVATASAIVLAPEVPALVADLHGADFPAALLAAASLVLVAASGWVVLLVVVAGADRTGTALRVLAPRAVRRALFVGAAGALAVVPAHADRAVAPPAHSLDGLRLPDRPTSAEPVEPVEPPATSRPAADPSTARTVVVRPGDTLWAIAARSLPPGAPAADVAVACRRWHAANRAVIGDDPDLILPEQRLAPPRKDRP